MDTHETRVAVIGDISGHAGELIHALTNLGADPHTLELPPDLTVIQVGDLVHKGPDSKHAISIVDNYLRTQPEQWIQLVGNHEALYLTEQPQFLQKNMLDGHDADIIRRWWDESLMRTAAAIKLPTGDSVLVTHAGVTHKVWKTILEAPATAEEAAAKIEGLKYDELPWLWEPGALLTGDPDDLAGPLWASAVEELYPSWRTATNLYGEKAPFHQIHGHTHVYNWYRREWYDDSFKHLTVVNDKRHQTCTTLAGKKFFSIDPEHGTKATSRWAPLITRGTVVTPEPESTQAGEWVAAAS